MISFGSSDRRVGACVLWKSSRTDYSVQIRSGFRSLRLGQCSRTLVSSDNQVEGLRGSKRCRVWRIMTLPMNCAQFSPIGLSYHGFLEGVA